MILNDTYSIALAVLAPRSRVLDLGCGPGAFGRRLLDFGHTVTGVDVLPPLLEEARDAGLDTILADLDDEDALDPLEGQVFDSVVCLDVLEHLRDPINVLRRAVKLLSPTGTVVVSLPNVTHASVRLHLLSGHFRYADSGLLDRSHLRFFDRESARELIAEAGLEAVEWFPVERSLDQSELAFDASVADDVREMVEQRPDALVYQWVIWAHPAGAVSPAESPLLSVYRDLVAHARALQDAAAYARTLEERVLEAEASRAAAEVSRAAAETRITAEQQRAATFERDLESARAGEWRTAETLTVRTAQLDTCLADLRYLELEVEFLRETNRALEARTGDAEAGLAHERLVSKELEARARAAEERLATITARIGYRVMDRAARSAARSRFTFAVARRLGRRFAD